MKKVARKKAVAKKAVKKVVLPKFLEDKKVGRTIILRYKPVMTNWLRTRAFFKEAQPTIKMLEQMMMVEMQSELPREQVLRDLTKKYNTLCRLEIIEQMDTYFKNNEVQRIVPRKKKGEKEAEKAAA